MPYAPTLHRCHLGRCSSPLHVRTNHAHKVASSHSQYVGRQRAASIGTPSVGYHWATHDAAPGGRPRGPYLHVLRACRLQRSRSSCTHSPTATRVQALLSALQALPRASGSGHQSQGLRAGVSFHTRTVKRKTGDTRARYTMYTARGVHVWVDVLRWKFR